MRSHAKAALLKIWVKSLLPVAVLGLIAAGWAVAWKFAANATNTALDEWFAQERVAGRVWACADRGVGGFPLRIEVKCAAPTFSGAPGKLPLKGSTGDLLASAEAWRPSLITATIQPPLRLRAGGDQGGVDLDWTSLTATVQSKYGALELGSLRLEGAAFTAAWTGYQTIEAKAQSVAVDIRPDPARPNSLLATAAMKNLAAPALDQTLRDNSPLNVSFRALVSFADALSRPGDGPPLERWRLAGGRVQIEEAHIDRGPLDIAANGLLDLDGNHRPRGQIAVAASGLDDLLGQFGVPAAALAIGGLFGGGDSVGDMPAPAAKKGALRVVAKLENGRASLGPVRLPLALKPLY